MNNYYVYTHNNIITGECFYVGIGKNDRVFDGGSKRNNYGFLGNIAVTQKNSTTKDDISTECLCEENSL